ncbi:MAG: hypothetical protein HOL40_08275 [Cellvibrionales bacterium]|jgi:hypothetical protein|nr:hypothetical protein [Cellvibrionales bacterium]
MRANAMVKEDDYALDDDIDVDDNERQYIDENIGLNKKQLQEKRLAIRRRLEDIQEEKRLRTLFGE